MTDATKASVAYTSEQASVTVAMAALPPHLRLGITLPGMRELYGKLPRNAVQQVNKSIPKDKKTRKPKFPRNKVINGYVNQFFVTNEAKADNLGVCERLKAAGSPLFREELEGLREVNGATHEETLDSAYNLAEVLDESGRTEEAARLRSEYGV